MASAAVDDRPTPAASTAPPPGAITGAAARRSWTSKCVPRDGTTWTNSRREAAKPRPWTRSRYVPAGMPRSWKRPTLSVSMMRRSRPCAVTAAPDTGWLRSSVTIPSIQPDERLAVIITGVWPVLRGLGAGVERGRLPCGWLAWDTGA